MPRRKKSEVNTEETIEVKIPAEPEPVKEEPPKPEPVPEEERELTESQVKELLIELLNTPYWRAIKWYTDGICYSLDSSLRTIDPFKEPTNAARAQGARNGIVSLENYIKGEVENRKRTEKGMDKGETLPGGFAGY